MRQHVAAIGRRVTTLCKHEDGLRQQLALYHVYYNFCLPHASLRVSLPQPLPTHGTGSATHWRPRQAYENRTLLPKHEPSAREKSQV